MKLKYLKNVVTLEYNKEKCIGCRNCTIVCPHGVFKIINKKAEICDKNKCMECGACEKNCPVNAITVNANVGCASAILNSWLKGNQASCDCSIDECC
jgi:NAD-dependent dihydropyrimidine dehydrogenase PreA subunit